MAQSDILTTSSILQGFNLRTAYILGYALLFGMCKPTSLSSLWIAILRPCDQHSGSLSLAGLLPSKHCVSDVERSCQYEQ